MSQQNRQYWNDRARASGGAATATTDDFYLRELEYESLLAKILELCGDQPGSALDVGCGDGLTTVRLTEALRAWTFSGIDFADNMIEIAQTRVADASDDLRARVGFHVGDATDLEAALGDRTFDLILSGRCLINLETPERQYAALRQMAERLTTGGWYLGIENFIDGHDNLNEARAVMGLPAIPVRWHNLFFIETEFLAEARLLFDPVEILDFTSSYYFATRVVYSALCHVNGETPDYGHDIHRLSRHLPPFGRFSPIRLVVGRRR